jgi:hypothetical protein
VGTLEGKNSAPTTGATYKRMNRSNRSSDHPKTDATMAFLACRLVADAVVPAPSIFAIVMLFLPV